MRACRNATLTAGILAVSALCALPVRPAAAQALWRPPEDLFREGPDSFPRGILLSHFKLGPVAVTLYETPFREVQRAFPGSAVGEAGDADYVAWLCYVFGTGSQRSMVWLESGESGGRDGPIMGFTLLRISSTAQVDARCARFPGSGDALRLPLPIALGASRSQIVRVFGPPYEEHGDTLLYFRETELPERPIELRTVDTFLSILLRGGAVVRIDAWEFSMD